VVFPLAGLGVASLGAFGGHAARIGITSTGLRSFGSQFAQSVPFGAGYSFGTFIGFPKNYNPATGSYTRTHQVWYPNMAFGSFYQPRRYRRYRSRRYRRYSNRYYRRYRRYY
jgi:hypothetical protein